MLSWPNKDPDELLDYKVDWSVRLDSDTIDTSTWIVPSGITKVSDSATDDATTIWLSGGTLSEQYDITNRITTAAGRIMDQTVRIKIRTK